MQLPNSAPGREDDGPPPFLGSWKRVYAAVLCYLVLTIGVLYAITRVFTYS